MPFWGPSSREIAQAREIEQLKRSLVRAEDALEHWKRIYYRSQLLQGIYPYGIDPEMADELMRQIGHQWQQEWFKRAYPKAIHILPS